MQKQCRCHGMSGSCSVQTCWLQLANFAEIAQTLKQLYRKAIKINFEHAPYGFTMGNSARVSVEGILRKHFDSLVYLEDSPDYCKANALIGEPNQFFIKLHRKSNNEIINFRLAWYERQAVF